MVRPRKYSSEEERYQAQLKASRDWKVRNIEHNRKRSREWYQSRTNSLETYCILLLQSIKRRQKDTDIDLDYLLSLSDRCAITGKSFEFVNRYEGTFSNPLAPSIDRIDNKDGYYRGNVQVVLNCVNKMKNDMPDEEFRELWKELTSWPAS